MDLDNLKSAYEVPLDNEGIPLSLAGTTTNLQVFPNGSTSPRVSMQGVHYPQATSLAAPETRLIFSGVERDYANYMLDITVEHTCKIGRIVHRYAKPGHENRKEPLETTLFVKLIGPDIVEDVWDAIQIIRYDTNHRPFGNKLILTKHGRNVAVGQILHKGTTLASTKTVVDGEFSPGVNLNTILASHYGVIEDSVIISRSAAAKMETLAYMVKRVVVGENEYPLYLYTDANGNPSIVPAIGDKVRSDGILFASRKYDPILAGVEMTEQELRTPCGHFDNCVFVDPEATVVDIKVYRDDHKEMLRDKDGRRMPNPKLSTPAGMQEYLDEYAEGLSIYQGEIRDFYTQVIKRGKRVCDDSKIMTPAAKQVITYAIADKPMAVIPDGKRNTKQFGQVKNDDYTIEISISYPIPVSVSSKLTDTMGGKGIAGKVVDDDKMPYDDNGVRVDLIMSDNAMMRRTNWNRGFEIYANASRRCVERRIMALVDDGKIQEAYDLLLHFTYCINPRWHDAIRATHKTDVKVRELVDSISERTLRIWCPSDNVYNMDTVERNIKRFFPPETSPLNIPMPDGTIARTKLNFTIGELYIIRLDKIGRDYQALAAGKYQPFGTISKQHSSDKDSRPVNETAMKHQGPAESRHMQAFIGGDVCADGHDRSNNPVVGDEIIYNLLTAEIPTNIPHAIDRKIHPLGNNRVMAVNQHILRCDGIEYTTERS